MNSLWQRFCEESSMHGFHDLRFARSTTARVCWTLLLITACSMTTYQISNIAENFIHNPTRTQITSLPSDVQIKIPPYVISQLHFVNWLNFANVKILDFDLETLFFALSYFLPVYTRLNVDLVKADRKLRHIMKKGKIRNFYNLGLALSLPNLELYETTTNDNGSVIHVKSQKPFSRYFDHNGINYLCRDNQEIELINFKMFTNIESTKIYKNFAKYFNHNIAEEYLLYGRYRYTGMESVYLKTFLPVLFNSVGDKSTFRWMNILQNNYDVYLKGTLYKWIPTTDKKCTISDEMPFFVECALHCSKYRTFNKFNLLVVGGNYSSTEDLINLQGADDNTEKHDICMEKCQSGCNKWNYQFSVIVDPIQVNYTEMSSDVFTTIVLRSNSDAHSTLVVSLLPSVTWFEALANVGGLLGLWLGGSIISFVQIIYLICWVPVENWCRRKFYKGDETGKIDLQVCRHSPQKTDENFNENLNIRTEMSDTNLSTYDNLETDSLTILHEEIRKLKRETNFEINNLKKEIANLNRKP